MSKKRLSILENPPEVGPERKTTAAPPTIPAPPEHIQRCVEQVLTQRPIAVDMGHDLCGYAIFVQIVGGGNVKHCYVRGQLVEIVARDTVPGPVQVHVLAVRGG